MTRTSMTNDEVKSVEIAILDYIDMTCKANGLQYYLSYGTLLGAVRHKGFIPWDDDIDIYMRRPDYDKFIELSRNTEQTQYKVLERNSAPDYYYEFAKVVDIRTGIISKNNLREIQDEGVWVDIFPLDRLPKAHKLVKRIINAFVAMRILSVYQSFPKGKFSKALFPFWCVARLIGPRFFLAITDRMAKAGRGEKYVGYMCSMGVSKYFFPLKWCDDIVEVDFEGKKYPAFREYDGYLRFQYGDYMQLPPEEKRVSHPVSAFWR